MTSIPQWADAQLSQDLASIREIGEGQTVEFKDRLADERDQYHRIAQECAAFGTSGDGTVFIGVNDNGELVGLDLPNGEARDKFLDRVLGVVKAIKPQLRIAPAFAVENGFVVLALQVPAQDEPVYYYDHRPYIRDGRISRPATPDEVKDRVWAHPSSQFKRHRELAEMRQADLLHQIAQRSADRMDEQSRQASQDAAALRKLYASFLSENR